MLHAASQFPKACPTVSLFCPQVARERGTVALAPPHTAAAFPEGVSTLAHQQRAGVITPLPVLGLQDHSGHLAKLAPPRDRYPRWRSEQRFTHSLTPTGDERLQVLRWH